MGTMYSNRKQPWKKQPKGSGLRSPTPGTKE